jgi:hypothetical protein
VHAGDVRLGAADHTGQRGVIAAEAAGIHGEQAHRPILPDAVRAACAPPPSVTRRDRPPRPAAAPGRARGQV